MGQGDDVGMRYTIGLYVVFQLEKRAAGADRAALAVPTESEEALEAFAVLYETNASEEVSCCLSSVAPIAS